MAALKRVWIASPNYSSRGGVRVRLIVVHTAEGARTYQDLGAFFASRSAEASSHVGIDDTPGKIGEYVKRPDKAWTHANANPYSVAVELCAFAEWSPAEWNRHPAMLENCGRWIGEESRHYGIPLDRLSAGEAQGGKSGVCGHVDLGAGGGGHWDPGPSFPWSTVMAVARGDLDAAQPPKPPPTYAMNVATMLAMTAEVPMPPEYLIHTKLAKGGQYHDRTYGVYPNGLVRYLNAADKAALAAMPGGAPATEQLTAEDPAKALYLMDQTLRGFLAKR